MIVLLLLLAPTALAFVMPYHRYRIPTTKIKHDSPLFSSSTTTNDDWKSCAQPRFDEFANCIVGPWSNVKDQKQQNEVEEVMRSCGGKYFLSCMNYVYVSSTIILFQLWYNIQRSYTGHSRATAIFDIYRRMYNNRRRTAIVSQQSWRGFCLFWWWIVHFRCREIR